MRRILCLTAIAFLFAASGAAAQALDEAWSDDGTVLEIGEFDGQHNLDILFGINLTTLLELRDVVTGGTLYAFPSAYRNGGLLLVLGRDLDGDPSDELVLYSNHTGNPVDGKLGLFDMLGAAAAGAVAAPEPGPYFGPRWEMPFTNGFPDALLSADFDGTGYRSIIVVGGTTFSVYQFSDGQKIYDWDTDGTPGRYVTDVQVVDLDLDGRDELMVTSLPAGPGGGPAVHIIRSTLPLAIGEPAALETRLAAAQNAPNPFAGPTAIAFTLPVGERVSVQVYDPAGRRVRTLLDEKRAAGRHRITWDGRDDGGNDLRSGVYFYEIRAGGERLTRKMLRLR